MVAEQFRERHILLANEAVPFDLSFGEQVQLGADAGCPGHLYGAAQALGNECGFGRLGEKPDVPGARHILREIEIVDARRARRLGDRGGELVGSGREHGIFAAQELSETLPIAAKSETFSRRRGGPPEGS
jgi:hypothetical protein